MKVYTQLIEQLGKLNDNSTRTYAMIKDNLIFVIELLREINLYASPIWFDDLFYYFYYLNLDKIFKNITGVLGNFMKSRDAPPIAETGADFYMDVYPSRENDTDIDNQKENRYVSYLRMKERNPGPENIRHLNHWLNLIYYGPFTPKTHTKKVSLLMAKAKELLKPKENSTKI
jgi:hypothetical protein